MEVMLFPGIPGGRWAKLGPLTGTVEQAVDPQDAYSFGRMMDSLLELAEGTRVGPGHAMDLAVTDLDRLAFELYSRNFGNRVEGHRVCGRCNRAFEVSLDLVGPAGPLELVDSFSGEGPDEEGRFHPEAGPPFRLPTLRDQLEVRHMPPKQARHVLIQRCTGCSELSEAEAVALEESMESIGPLLSGELTPSCPHCRWNEGPVSFGIQQVLVTTLALEHPFLLHEIHAIARAYGWSRAEILGLTREDRQRHVRMVLAERAAD